MVEKPKTSRQLQAERMRLKIQRTVEEMARTRALDDIKIQEICQVAEISVGNFYLYFSSKEEALIYSYRAIDERWKERKFEEISDGWERAQKIMDTHLETLGAESVCFVTQLYISQLKLFDEYFFTKKRYLSQVLTEALVLAQVAGKVTLRYEASDLAQRLLVFSRGLAFDYCLHHLDDAPAWLERAKRELREFQSLFIIP